MADLNTFEDYFQIADSNQDGKIGASEAISFFEGSNLLYEVLAQICMYADEDKNGSLGREEFYNALKLVTVAQAGRNLTPELVKSAFYGPAASKIPPPIIETSHYVGSSNASQCIDGSEKSCTWPRFSQSDVDKYIVIFHEMDKNNEGKISGERSMTLFLSWKIPIGVLKKIWDLSDQDKNGTLSLKEFCIALYLIERYRDGFYLPDSLPHTILHDETLLKSTTSDQEANDPTQEADDVILAFAIKASIESARTENFSGFIGTESNADYAPSAPPIESLSNPSIFTSSIDSNFTSQIEERRQEVNNINVNLGTCSICIEDPVDVACVPCGHMAGCMRCLQKIKESGGECPICRWKIERVIKLYIV